MDAVMTKEGLMIWVCFATSQWSVLNVAVAVSECWASHCWGECWSQAACSSFISWCQITQRTLTELGHIFKIPFPNTSENHMTIEATSDTKGKPCLFWASRPLLKQVLSLSLLRRVRNRTACSFFFSRCQVTLFSCQDCRAVLMAALAGWVLSLGIESGALPRDWIRCAPLGLKQVLSLGIQSLWYHHSTCGSARAQICVKTTTFAFCALQLKFIYLVGMIQMMLINKLSWYDGTIFWFSWNVENMTAIWIKPVKGDASFWKTWKKT